MEHEKRIRREIANSNERRRMQSINAGFQTLRDLLPQQEGEKLSKAAILQQTSDFIYSLEQEKTRLLTQNCQLKRLLGQQSAADSDSPMDSPQSAGLPHRHRDSAEMPAVGPAAADDDDEDDEEMAAGGDELLQLRADLDRERQLRELLERQLQALQQQQCYGSSNKRPRTETDEQLISDSTASVVEEVTATVSPQRAASPVDYSEESPVAVTQLPAAPVAVTQLSAAPVAEPARRLFVSSNTSRQNLDTIVEAIRHLEGDHLFQDSMPGRPDAEDVSEPALTVLTLNRLPDTLADQVPDALTDLSVNRAPDTLTDRISDTLTDLSVNRVPDRLTDMSVDRVPDRLTSLSVGRVPDSTLTDLLVGAAAFSDLSVSRTETVGDVSLSSAGVDELSVSGVALSDLSVNCTGVALTSEPQDAPLALTTHDRGLQPVYELHYIHDHHRSPLHLLPSSRQHADS